jgi:hypothetical protein
MADDDGKIMAMIDQYMECVFDPQSEEPAPLFVEAVSYLVVNKGPAKKWITFKFGELVKKANDAKGVLLAEYLNVLITRLYK